ncbi:hypothetical protein BH11BAC4_BH11BAC4_04870 [soil metagenome]
MIEPSAISMPVRSPSLKQQQPVLKYECFTEPAGLSIGISLEGWLKYLPDANKGLCVAGDKY